MTEFDPACRRCPRLAEFIEQGRARYPAYHCAPVAPFGDRDPRLLVVGLAPGFHGANASGRPFTGDYAGILLYETLHEFGWSSAPVSKARDDGLVLRGCRITNAVKCVPPGNKPTPAEVATCNSFLAAEISALRPSTVILALGAIAHGAVLRACGQRASAFAFGHGREHRLGDDRVLIDSYHCSRYNTNTGRLTSAMFREVVGRASRLANATDDVA
ncbi:MAG TPA: uracil-DNA glycosylase [Steroidobacteraceae bacterium]|nr:uracil-DNA glycosylase [Steroidobacteraceae bacterium]